MSYRNFGEPITAKISIGATATELKVSTNPLERRYILIIANDSAQTVYLGGSTVTTNDGIPVSAGASYEIQFDPVTIQHWYAIAASAVNVRILECA